MSMSRKNYVAIAAAIKSAQLPDMSGTDAEKAQHRFGVKVAAQAMADHLQADNPRFDRGRFLEACGVTFP